MKKLLFISTFVLISLSVNSQSFCESSSYSPNRDFLVNTNRHADYTNYSFCVTIYVHVIRDDSGEGGQSPTNVNEALTYLDDAFNPYFIFLKWDNNINYIDDSNLFNAPTTILNDPQYDHPDGVDLYLFGDSYVHPVLGHGIGSTEGVGVSAKLLVAGSFGPNLEYPLVRSHVLSHEFGHVLNLWHTHHGTVIEDLEGDPNQCPELISGANGWECGDYIPDTPADPNMGFNVDVNTCEWLGSGDHEDPYQPDPLNIMSYTQPVCMEYFSFQQARRMKTALALVSFLQDLSTYTSSQGNPCSPSVLNFYPNSADGELFLDLTNKPVDTYSYNLYDSNGIVVVSGQSPNVIETIDTSPLVEGLYFLHFFENGEVTIKQIIIDH